MRILFALLLVFSSVVYAEGSDVIYEVVPQRRVLQLFEEQTIINIDLLPDLVEKDDKILACVSSYIEKQTKTYAKIVKNTLYDLILDFDRITSRVYGKKLPDDKVSYDDKIEALAKVQCEAYYTMGVLK